MKPTESSDKMMIMMMNTPELDDIKMCLFCGSGDPWLLYPLRPAFRHRVIIVDRGHCFAFAVHCRLVDSS